MPFGVFGLLALRQKFHTPFAVEPVPGDPEGRTYAEGIAQVLAEKALSGDIRAAQELTERAEGKARQSVEIHNGSLRDAFEPYVARGIGSVCNGGHAARMVPK
jgi:hypothetical protein